MDVLEYVVRLRGAAAAAAEVRGLAGEFDKLAVSQHRAGGAAGALGGIFAKMATGGALALAGIGFEAVKMSANFNHEMLRIRTDAGASTAELARMKAGVLDLASSGASMGQGPMSLAQGLYHLESLGQRGARALQALKLASQESAISGANLSDTTTAMGAAMYVGIKGTGNLTHLMGILNATVGAGNMRFQQLTEALGTGILPSAKIAGLGITDVSAALAVLTDAGYQASSAGAQLGTALHFLYAPSSKAKTALGDIGMTSTQMATDMHKPKGLLVALTDLRNHLDRLPGGLKGVAAAQTLNAILPGGRGRVLLTELTMLDRLRGKYEQINRISGGFAGSVAAQRQDPQTRLKTAEAALQAGMIRFGDVLGPIVLPALTKLVMLGAKVLGWMTAAVPVVKGVVQWFGTLGAGVGKTGGAMGSFIHTVSHDFNSMWSTVKSVIGAIGSALTKLGGIAHHVFNAQFGKDLLTIGKFLLGFGKIVFNVVGSIVKTALPWFVKTFQGAFNVVAGVVHVIADLLTGHFGKAFTDIGQIIKGVAQTIVGAFGVITSPIQAAFKAVVGIIVGALNLVIDAINSVISSYNSVAGSIPILGGSLTIGQLSHISLGNPTTHPAGVGAPGAPPILLPSATGGPPILPAPTKTPRATPVLRGAPPILQVQAHFSHPIILNGREIARAHHRETVHAMASNR